MDRLLNQDLFDNDTTLLIVALVFGVIIWKITAPFRKLFFYAVIGAVIYVVMKDHRLF
ncbi:MAG: hypothetical protein KDK34_05365 [Leptospiraceae bacterium]|nr:hypothetical protein [Leptospiraceae bacterium]